MGNAAPSIHREHLEAILMCGLSEASVLTSARIPLLLVHLQELLMLVIFRFDWLQWAINPMKEGIFRLLAFFPEVNFFVLTIKTLVTCCVQRVVSNQTRLASRTESSIRTFEILTDITQLWFPSTGYSIIF